MGSKNGEQKQGAKVGSENGERNWEQEWEQNHKLELLPFILDNTVHGCIWMYLDVFGCIKMYLDIFQIDWNQPEWLQKLSE